jgi:hypothetical protein
MKNTAKVGNQEVTPTALQLNVMEHVSLYLQAKEGLIEHNEP